VAQPDPPVPKVLKDRQEPRVQLDHLVNLGHRGHKDLQDHRVSLASRDCLEQPDKPAARDSPGTQVHLDPRVRLEQPVQPAQQDRWETREPRVLREAKECVVLMLRCQVEVT
jgi:hypothetical protein